MHVSPGTSVGGPRKRYHGVFSDVRFFFFFTRFALTPCRAPRETSENIDTDLGDAMDGQSLRWDRA